MDCANKITVELLQPGSGEILLHLATEPLSDKRLQGLATKGPKREVRLDLYNFSLLCYTVIFDKTTTCKLIYSIGLAHNHPIEQNFRCEKAKSESQYIRSQIPSTCHFVHACCSYSIRSLES